jgi:hypothetical protein
MYVQATNYTVDSDNIISLETFPVVHPVVPIYTKCPVFQHCPWRCRRHSQTRITICGISLPTYDAGLNDKKGCEQHTSTYAPCGTQKQKARTNYQGIGKNSSIVVLHRHFDPYFCCFPKIGDGHLLLSLLLVNVFSISYHIPNVRLLY